MVRHADAVLSRAMIVRSVWGPAAAIQPRTVDVHMRRLRRALARTGDGDPIRTVWSGGYTLCDSRGARAVEPRDPNRPADGAAAPVRAADGAFREVLARPSRPAGDNDDGVRSG